MPIDTLKSPYWGPNGELIGALGITRNITAPHAEREAQQRFEALFHANPTPMAVAILPEGRCSDVNDVFLKLFGYSREAVIGKTPDELDLFARPDQRAAVAEQVQTVGDVVNCEVQFRRQDWEIIHNLFSTEFFSTLGR